MENLTKAQLINAITNFLDALMGQRPQAVEVPPAYEPVRRQAMEVAPAYEPPRRQAQRFDLGLTLNFATDLRSKIEKLKKYKKSSVNARELYADVKSLKSMFNSLITQLDNNVAPTNLHYKVIHEIFDSYKSFLNDDSYKRKFSS
jgi:hypothetical protein